MASNTSALGRTEFAALDLINALPGQTAKVQARANASKGIVSKTVADRLVAAGKVLRLDDGRITTAKVTPDQDPTEGPVPTLEEMLEEMSNDPSTKGGEQTPEQQAEATEGDVEATTPAKVNGRKAKADASPYSTATPTNRIKRHGKSRRTGTETHIEDGLAKGSTFKVKGSGRYAVRCLTHKAETFVPDMTTAKPLQARTDQFCPECAKVVADKSKTGDTATGAA